MKKFYFFLGLWAALASANAQHGATFEDVPLEPHSWWNGSDESGGIESGEIWFPNDYNADWGSWSGFSVSNMKDSLTAGLSNQYSAIPAEGVGGSDNYAVVYVAGELVLELENPGELSGFYATNSTYAYLSMKDGDDYSKKFGGTEGSDPDYFKLKVSGIDIYGNETAEVEFLLADYTAENPEDDYLVNSWEWVDLSNLGVLKELRFGLESSDMGQWGMNTPAYFCIDNFNSRAPGLPEILAIAGMEDLELDNDSFYYGADGAGAFTSGGFTFKNSYNSDWESWSGFAASTKTDIETMGYINQFSAIAGQGALQTKSYAVAYPAGASEIEFEEAFVSGFFITNSTYSYWSMLLGDDYAKKFGGPEGEEPDWFKVTVAGISSTGDTTGTVEYYLADYRFEDDNEDYIVDDWQWVDLTALGSITKLRFSLSSSDTGEWGMNTPGYFCIDQMNHQDRPPEIVSPIATLSSDTAQEIFYVTLDSVFTDPDNPDLEMEFFIESIDNPELLNGSVINEGLSGDDEKTQLVLNITPGLTGEAEIVISALSNGKKSYHCFKVVVDFPVSSLFVEKPEIKVFPNPVRNSFNVLLPADAETAVVSDLSGKILYREKVTEKSVISISTLNDRSPGVYLLNVKTARGRVTRKIFKY